MVSTIDSRVVASIPTSKGMSHSVMMFGDAKPIVRSQVYE